MEGRRPCYAAEPRWSFSSVSIRAVSSSTIWVTRSFTAAAGVWPDPMVTAGAVVGVVVDRVVFVRVGVGDFDVHDWCFQFLSVFDSTKISGSTPNLRARLALV